MTTFLDYGRHYARSLSAIFQPTTLPSQDPSKKSFTPSLPFQFHFLRGIHAWLHKLCQRYEEISASEIRFCRALRSVIVFLMDSWRVGRVKVGLGGLLLCRWGIWGRNSSNRADWGSPSQTLPEFGLNRHELIPIHSLGLRLPIISSCS